jgi:peptide deformylase
MAYLKVVHLGTPLLRKRAEAVSEKELKDPFFRRFLDDLVETMQEYDGVGLAAPQVFVGKRVFVYQIPASEQERDQPQQPPKILINPVLSQFSKESESDWEGCLSLPDLRGQVERPTSLSVEAIDREGKKLSLRVSGFEARVIQHEFDHLEGKVFVDRMSDFNSLCFVPEYIKYHQRQ